MKSHTALRTSALLLLLAAVATISLAQTAPAVRGERAGIQPDARAGDPTRSSLRARAAELAASTADAAPAWGDRKAAVRVLCEAADLLWGDDPDRARSWLERAWESVGVIPEEGDNSAVARYRSSSAKSRGRGMVLAVAHRHDKELADRLLAQLEGEGGQAASRSSRGIFDDKTPRIEQLLNLSIALVGTDPDGAARLAELSLADGISFRLQSVLLALRERDQGAADRLFDAALRRLAARPEELDEAQIIASYLFTPGRVIGVGGDNVAAAAVSTRRPTAGRTPAEADPVRTRRFLNVVQWNLLSSPAPSMTRNPSLQAQEIVSLAGTLEDRFKFYAPDLWTPVAQRVTAVLPDLAPRDISLPQSVKERLEIGTSTAAVPAELNRLYVDGLEEAAEKEVDPVARKFAYIRAALATPPSDLPRGLSLAGRIAEDTLRKRISSFLTYRAALAALEKGQPGEATELAQGLEPLPQAVVYIAAAQRLNKERQSGESDAHAASRKARAAELLAAAEKMLKGSEGSREALQVRLGLVSALAPLDTRRALYSLGEIVTDVNRLDSFDPVDAAPPQVVGLYGLPIQSSLPILRGSFSLKDAFSPLSRIEFEESLYIAGKLKAPSTRGICIMEIARGILAGDDSLGRQHASGPLR